MKTVSFYIERDNLEKRSAVCIFVFLEIGFFYKILLYKCRYVHNNALNYAKKYLTDKTQASNLIFFGDEFVPCNTAITFCFDYILITIHLFTFLFFNLSLDKHKNVFSSLQRWTDNIHCNSVEFCPCPCQWMHTRQSKKKTYMELRGRNPNVLTDVQEVFS